MRRYFAVVESSTGTHTVETLEDLVKIFSDVSPRRAVFGSYSAGNGPDGKWEHHFSVEIGPARTPEHWIVFEHCQDSVVLWRGTDLDLETEDPEIVNGIERREPYRGQKR